MIQKVRVNFLYKWMKQKATHMCQNSWETVECSDLFLILHFLKAYFKNDESQTKNGTLFGCHIDATRW